MIEEKKQYSISYLAKTEADKVIVLNSLNEVGALNPVEGRATELKLAYPIKKQTSALFGSITFEASPDTISKIDERLKFVDGILRFLIVSVSNRKPNPRASYNYKTKESSNDVSGAPSSESEETSMLQETAGPIVEQTNQSISDENLIDSNHILQDSIDVENKIDDIAFNKKLEEILIDSETK